MHWDVLSRFLSAWMLRYGFFVVVVMGKPEKLSVSPDEQLLARRSHSPWPELGGV